MKKLGTKHIVLASQQTNLGNVGLALLAAAKKP